MKANHLNLVALAPSVATTTPSDVVLTCRGVLEKHARSFSAAAVFLTPAMRDDAAIAYAFCRLVDDAVDEAKSVEAARAELGHIEAMLNAYSEPSPIVSAYMDLCKRTNIGLAPARALIKGAESDLARVRIPNDAELLVYCYRVAGTVGLMMCGILGVTSRNARQHAIDLGIGMQLTNICRDVLEDAGMNRVYLPGERLARYGITAEVVAATGGSESLEKTELKVRVGIARVVDELLQEADRYYSSGKSGFHHIPSRPRLAIIVAGALYREIGVTLRAANCDPLRGRVSVPAWRKLLLTLRSARTWVLGLLPRSRNERYDSSLNQLRP